MKIPELLSPAGDPEKLNKAILYGADAVYLAGTRFGMRAAASNFSDNQLSEAVRFWEKSIRYLQYDPKPRRDRSAAFFSVLSGGDKCGRNHCSRSRCHLSVQKICSFC